MGRMQKEVTSRAPASMKVKVRAPAPHAAMLVRPTTHTHALPCIYECSER